MIKNIIKSRIAEIKYIQAHRKEVQRIAKSLGYTFPFHDLDKIILIPFVGDRIATEVHRRFAKHHLHFYNKKSVTSKKAEKIPYFPNAIEAAIDWESARFTKPDKPLDAYHTWKKYYSDVDMEKVLKNLGFWPEEV